MYITTNNATLLVRNRSEALLLINPVCERQAGRACQKLKKTWITRHATLLFASSRDFGSLKACHLCCNTRKRILDILWDGQEGRIESMADSVFIAARLVYKRATEPFRINVSEICNNQSPPRFWSSASQRTISMKAGLQLSDAIRSSYRQLESGQ